MIRVDVIVAVRNEEQAIPVFVAELAALPLAAGVHLRTIFVEDSSTDGTRPLLRSLAAANASVGYHFLERGFGQPLAIVYGLRHSDADAMIMMDVDGSHPPSVIPAMIDAFGAGAGAGVVQCRRRSLAGRAVYRDAGAALFFGLARRLTGVDVDAQRIYFRLVSAEVARRLLAAPRTWHYLRFPLSLADPAPVRFIEVDAAERRVGESKYGPLRLARLAIDAVLSLMPPLRLKLALAGLAVAGVALALAADEVAGVVSLAAAAWLGRRYAQLGRRDVLERMVAVESANTGKVGG